MESEQINTLLLETEFFGTFFLDLKSHKVTRRTEVHFFTER